MERMDKIGRSKSTFGKRGQQTMGMPFGMIFAIFLIIVFVVIAFIAMGGFLDIGRASSVGLFYDEFQEAVDEAWSGQSGEFDFKIDLPDAITELCFANLSDVITNKDLTYKEILNYDVYEANTFLAPPEAAEGMQWKLINHLDIAKITSQENPYCIPVKKTLRIKKGFYDKLVMVE
jgi:hypothetical protein